MGLFGKKKDAPSSKSDLEEIEASVQHVRRRLGNAKMPIDELFRLMGEDDRKVLANIPRPKPQSEPQMPDEIGGAPSPSR
jgi:hypothetical protein